MPNLGMGEIILILLVILLFFGAKRIPEIAGSFGKGIKEFKKNLNEAQRAITEPDGGNERLTPPPVDTPKSAAADEEREPKKLMR
jgi:sec-independent protein translocase protein TatA